MDDRAGGGGERERTGEENEQNVLTRRSNSLLSLGPIKAVIYDHVSSMCDAAEAPSDGETCNLDGWCYGLFCPPLKSRSSQMFLQEDFGLLIRSD